MVYYHPKQMVEADLITGDSREENYTLDPYYTNDFSHDFYAKQFKREL